MVGNRRRERVRAASKVKHSPPVSLATVSGTFLSMLFFAAVNANRARRSGGSRSLAQSRACTLRFPCASGSASGSRLMHPPAAYGVEEYTVGWFGIGSLPASRFAALRVLENAKL